MRRFLLLILSILIVISIFFLIRSNIFTIKSVDIKLEKIACTNPSQIRDSVKLVGQNFFFVNSAKIENALKKKYLCIKAIELSRYFPDKVKLQVFGREPAAILVALKSEEATSAAALQQFSEATASAHENFLVDTEGVIYSTNIEQITAPRIYLSGFTLTVGQMIKDELITSALKILQKVKTFAIDIKEAEIYSRNVLLINTVPKIIFRLDDKIDTQLASLQLILNQAKIDQETIEFIDLRFDKPIVRLAPKKNG